MISYRYTGDRVAIIAGTGVKVWAIVGYRRLGMSDVEIQEALPHLTIEQVRAALAYYEKHPTEIERVLAYNNISEEEAQRRQARYAAMAKFMRSETKG